MQVSAVSFGNTRPFIYGMEHMGVMDRHRVSLDIPSECARKLISGEANVGLVPVAAINSIPNARIITGYGIGGYGPVDSVMLFSQVPLEEIRSVLLDYHSLSSIRLVKVLAAMHWKKNWQWAPASQGYEELIHGEMAGVVIGDRAFTLNERYAYRYDLSEAWFELTGLPFLFAAWVSNTDLPDAYIEELNEAFAFGTSHLENSVAQASHPYLDAAGFVNYLQKIRYERNENMMKGFRQFNEYISMLEPQFNLEIRPNN